MLAKATVVQFNAAGLTDCRPLATSTLPIVPEVDNVIEMMLLEMSRNATRG